MTTLEQIQETVEALSDKDLRALGAWLDELRAQRWDRQIEADVMAGKLDKSLDGARAEIAAGKTRSL